MKDSVMRLEGKVALITGGSSGIGLATASRFVQEGARVVITGRRREALEQAVDQLGGGVRFAVGDAGDQTALDEAVAVAVDQFGGLDIVFANAGIAGNTPLGGTDIAEFRRIIETNLVGPFLTVQAALPHLQGGASVVLNGSVLAVLGMAGGSAYAASKAGVRSMARNMATELAPRDIRVNVVVPGATRTPIWDARAPTPEAFAQFEAMAARAIPFGRFGQAEEVASAVLFLASDESRYVTATEIVVDGGRTGASVAPPAPTKPPTDAATR